MRHPLRRAHRPCHFPSVTLPRSQSLRLLYLGLLTVVIGCSGNGGAKVTSSASSSSTGADKVIGFSALTLENPFFTIIADSLKQEAEKHGYSVIVMDSRKDVNTQAKHIDNFIVQNVTAIVINPADRVAIGPAIQKANEAGIPVFTCDLQCVAEDVTIAGHVGTDNYQGGKLAGQAMIEALGEEGGKVLVLHFKQANSCVLRYDGFADAIQAYNKDRATGQIEIVSVLEGGGLEDESFKATSDALQTHPDLRGIFAINDPSALGAWTALRQANKQDQIKIVGFDGQKNGKLAIREGKIYADPIQFPEKMGALTMENILKYIQGEEFEPVQLIPTELYRKADADADTSLVTPNEDN